MICWGFTVFSFDEETVYELSRVRINAENKWFRTGELGIALRRDLHLSNIDIFILKVRVILMSSANSVTTSAVIRKSRWKECDSWLIWLRMCML